MAGRDRCRWHGKQMKISPSEPLPSRWGFAILSMVVAGAALALSFVRVRGGFATQHDPGPWMLPRLLALALLVGGAIQLFLDLRSRRQNGLPLEKAEDVQGSAASKWQLPLLVAGMAVYVAMLPWIGFVIATTVFASLLLIASQVVWWRAILAAVVLAGVGYGLFAVLFKVPLPGGVWD